MADTPTSLFLPPETIFQATYFVGGRVIRWWAVATPRESPDLMYMPGKILYVAPMAPDSSSEVELGQTGHFIPGNCVALAEVL